MTPRQFRTLKALLVCLCLSVLALAVAVIYAARTPRTLQHLRDPSPRIEPFQP